MININGIQILDSWDGSREGVSVVISQPQKVYGSVLIKDEQSPIMVVIAVFKKDKSISTPYNLMGYKSDLEEGIDFKVKGLKKVFGPDVEIVRQ